MNKSEFVNVIPSELRQLNQWICWKLEQREGKPTKIPVNPRTGGNAQSNNKETWASFETALEACIQNRYSGLGFMFSKDNDIMGVDIDHCRDTEGTDSALSEQAKEILSTLDSYSEISPSGTGVHIIIKGKLPPYGRRSGNLEMYEEGRFFTVSGKVLEGYSRNVEERTEALTLIHSKYIAKPEKQQEIHSPGICDLNCQTIVDKAMSSAAGGKFHSLYQGNWKGEYPSQSEADLAFCNLLAFWCGRDPGKMDAIFRSSGLYRQKWDERRGGKGTYGEQTIQEAIRNCRDIYEPSKKDYRLEGGDKLHESETTLQKSEKSFKLSELGNAERLVSRHGNDIRYCHEWNKWLVWTGTHWQIDLTGEIERRAKGTVRSMYAEASQLQDEDQRAALAKYAARSETNRAITAMVELAKSEPSIPVISDQLDSDIWLLNCLNGTLNLQTGELKPHCRDDYITKLVPIEYDPTADFEEWAKFLNRIMSENQEIISFLQRAIGYSLTGCTREQCLFMPYGGGANGKSTFLEAIVEMLSGYAQRTPTDTLMAKDSSGVPNDIARLKGARFVVASEVEEGKRLAESLVKQMTGSEKITARFMRAEFFEFTPHFKLWVGTNHKPVIRGTDQAIWRRIKLIPFNVTIPPEERDKDLPNKLRKELSGILNWAVMGCMDWQKNGLGEPEEVKKATEGYRDEMDVISRFISECCNTNTDLSTKSQMLYKRYCDWCKDNGEYAVTQTKFSLRMSEKGFVKDRKASCVFWLNISLDSEPEESYPFQ